MNLDEFRSMPEAEAMVRDLWETHAPWWHAHFTEGADVEYVDQVIPEVVSRLGGARLVVDVGGGEGQVARAIEQTLGARVLVVEPAEAQARLARERGSLVVRGVAGAIPLGSQVADAVTVVLVLEHVLDHERAFAEFARVLVPGGRLVLALNHPIIQVPDSGLVEDVEVGETYWRFGRYLVEDASVEEVAGGVYIPFVHRPLSRYVNAALAAGLRLVEMAEPAPPRRWLERQSAPALLEALPRLLVTVWERP
jgi:SAM-dependent methyltransferase